MASRRIEEQLSFTSTIGTLIVPIQDGLNGIEDFFKGTLNGRPVTVKRFHTQDSYQISRNIELTTLADDYEGVASMITHFVSGMWHIFVYENFDMSLQTFVDDESLYTKDNVFSLCKQALKPIKHLHDNHVVTRTYHQIERFNIRFVGPARVPMQQAATSIGASTAYRI